MVKHSFVPLLAIFPEPSAVSWDTPPGDEAEFTCIIEFKCTGPSKKIVLVRKINKEKDKHEEREITKLMTFKELWIVGKHLPINSGRKILPGVGS